MHYLCGRAGQGSSHATDGVNSRNASLLCFPTHERLIYLCAASSFFNSVTLGAAVAAFQ